MQQPQLKSAGRTFQSRNPFTNEIVAEFPFLSDDEVKTKIEESWRSFRAFQKTDLASRKEKILRVAQLLEENPKKYAEVITLEMGKPINAALFEIQLTINHCRYYAENAEKLLAPKVVQTDHKQSQVEYEPLGPIYVISPFNFPFLLSLLNAIPALLIGNTILLRPADSTPQVGKIIEDLLIEAGFNNGELVLVYTKQDQTEPIIAHKHIRAISFTGSTAAGRNIASIAGKYSKKALMELGGSDPFVVLDDADLDKAAEIAIMSRLHNSGQVCFASKRFIVDNKVYDQFRDKILQKLPNQKLGDPSKPDTTMGPLARQDLVDNIDRQVQEAVQQGAKLLYGGKRPQDADLKNGLFYEPTLIEVDKDNLLAKEETFGPVFALIRVNGEQEAIEVANDTEYGLGCAVMGENVERARKVGKQIESGLLFINSMVMADSRLPVGGVKGSGFGRECGEYGIHELTNIRTVVLE
jgi:succinate-semialdehyde dehydrogenase/glutarate-semialdehyde dehydrogenase